MLDDPGRVRSQIISVVCQIQRFDFDCILVVSRKVIVGEGCVIIFVYDRTGTGTGTRVLVKLPVLVPRGARGSSFFSRETCFSIYRFIR